MTEELAAVWKAHTDNEFVHRDVAATMRTMTDDPSVLHVPTAMGGRGGDGVRTFYSTYFVGRNPDDFRIELISRTIGEDQTVSYRDRGSGRRRPRPDARDDALTGDRRHGPRIADTTAATRLPVGFCAASPRVVSSNTGGASTACRETMSRIDVENDVEKRCPAPSPG